MSFSSFRRHSGGGGDGHDDGHGGLLITPLLDLFVALIPFLILSAVLVKINTVDVGVSKPVTVLNKSPKKFQLQVKVSLDDVKIILNSQNYKTLAFDKEGKWTVDFHKAIIDIKKQNLEELEIFYEPTNDQVKLEQMMMLLDESRALKI
jgi:hypothetical protein